jgi:hypothetical protein
VLALLADCDVLFILGLAFWTIDVTHRVYFASFTKFDREKNITIIIQIHYIYNNI